MQKNKNGISVKEMKSINLSGPHDVCRLMKGKWIQIHKKPFELIYLICLDSDNCLKKVYELAGGSRTHATVSTYAAVRAATACESHRVILVHNHPGCRPSPSFKDMKFTWSFAKVFRSCGITLLDHIIIGERSCCSMVRLLNPKLKFELFNSFHK